MKTLIFSLLILTQLLPNTSLAEVQIKANLTGLVVIGSQSKQLNLLSNGSPLQTSKGIYFSGQQLNQEKQKVHVVAFLSNDMRQEQYWPFERPLSAPFEYKNNVYVSSYYLKTAVIGLNDNSIPIEEHIVYKHDLDK